VSSELGDVAKGGGLVAAVAGLLLALRQYMPRRDRNGENLNQIIEDRIKREIRNEKSIRELINEQRDDRMMECLTRMETFQKEMAESNTRLLLNMRDILRDVAVHRGLPVRYYEKD